jgi:RNA-directed DNA polymerase
MPRAMLEEGLGSGPGCPEVLDSVDHNLMVKAVEANTDQKWVVLYVRRWLTAPMQMPDGTVVGRDCGTPQGSAVSPILANAFMLVCHEC